MSDVDAQPKRPKGRSPSYPAVDLETAIHRARQLYEKERQHPAPVATVAGHWGYKSLNGPAALTLAALKKFGLVEDEGSGDARRARVSDLAVGILAHPDDAQRRAAIQDAALRPPIHREMWEKYGDSLPSDAALRWELTRDRGFTETGASEFIPEYQSTVAFAQLGGRVSLSTQASDRGSDDDGYERHPEVELVGRSPRQRRMTSEVARSFPIPLPGGATVVVEGEFPITEQDWALFMAVLNAMKPGLVAAKPQSDLIDTDAE